MSSKYVKLESLYLIEAKYKVKSPNVNSDKYQVELDII